MKEKITKKKVRYAKLVRLVILCIYCKKSFIIEFRNQTNMNGFTNKKLIPCSNYKVNPRNLYKIKIICSVKNKY